MPGDLIAVVDVGKTNAKLLLLDAFSGAIVWSTQRANEESAAASIRQLDVRGIEAWLMRALAEFPGKDRIRRLVPVAHGAAAVLVDPAGAVLLAPDYEDPAFERRRLEYERERDGFESTFSPRLPLGLNLGAQLHFLQAEHGDLFARASAILLLPQFLAWRFSGVMASEVTSLGCHTDLWRPRDRCFSAIAMRRGWAGLLPPLRGAGDVLGHIRPELALALGLQPACEVLCGIHDSNASYLVHLCRNEPGRPFAVVSSGTWTIVMASQVDLGALREERDMLANVDAFGSPVGTARFMGGREYHAIAGDAGLAATPTEEALREVVRSRAMALPAFADAGGPFRGQQGRLVLAEGLDAAARAALATLYCSVVTDLMLDLLAASGDLVIDGPLAGNPLHGPIVAALRPASTVWLSDSVAGSAQGAFALATGMSPGAMKGGAQRHAAPLALEGLLDYRTEWRERSAASCR